MKHRKQRVGIWLIGACGGVGGTVALGLAALAKRLSGSTGLVTALPELEGIDWASPGDFVLGGHEIRSQTLVESVRHLHTESGVFSAAMIHSCTATLRKFQRNIVPGVLLGSPRAIEAIADSEAVTVVKCGAEAIEAIAADLVAFRKKNRLDHVIVVNVASTEPPLKAHPSHRSYTKLSKELVKKRGCVLPSSSLYALGAFAADCSCINFTPSAGSRIPAIEEYAAECDVLFGGRDGKTGETLLKSVLAPLFATRHLHLHSWVGHNVLGNRDGQVLSDPVVKASKLKSKDGLVGQIVGYKPQSRTSIEYVPSLNDWKVAWDFIHFEGFLGTKMNMQFVWTGSDSVLAAPLVIDLVRLTHHEFVNGRRGRMDHLGCFFKDPEGTTDHNYFNQWRRLTEHLLA